MTYELTSNTLVRDALKHEKRQFFRYLNDAIFNLDAKKRIEVSSEKYIAVIKAAGALGFFKDAGGVVEKFAGGGTGTAAALVDGI